MVVLVEMQPTPPCQLVQAAVEEFHKPSERIWVIQPVHDAMSLRLPDDHFAERVAGGPEILESEDLLLAQDEGGHLTSPQWPQTSLDLGLGLEAGPGTVDVYGHAGNGEQGAVQAIVPMQRNRGVVLHARGEALLHPALMRFLDTPETRRRERGRLGVDQLVVDVAEKDQVFVQVPVGGSNGRVASRAGGACCDDVGDVSERYGRLPWAGINDEQPVTVCEGAAVA